MENEMGRTCSSMVEIRNAYKILVRKPEGKRLLEGLGIDGETILE
jgi:hypothetical protein